MDKAQEFRTAAGASVLVLLGVLIVRTTPVGADLYGRLLAEGMLMLWAPLLVVILAMRSHPAAFGMQPGNEKSLRYGAGALVLAAVTLPLLLLPLFSRDAPLPLYRRYDAPFGATWGAFVYGHLLLGFSAFCQEWFFRGFLLYGLWRGIGASSLILQAVLFLLVNLRGPLTDSVTALPAALILGFVTWRCGSFIPAFLARWAATLYLDLLFVLTRHL